MNNTNPSYFNKLNLIYWALIGSQILFAIIASLIQSGKVAEAEAYQDTMIFRYIAIVLIAGASFASHTLPNKIIPINKDQEIKEKLQMYMNRQIMRLALLEGPSMLCIVFYILKSDMIFLLGSVVCIVFMLNARPKKEKIIEELEIRAEDQNMI